MTDFSPEPERSIPFSENYDPIKEGMPISDPDPVNTGIKKRHEEILIKKSIGDFMAMKGSKLLKVSSGPNVPQLGKTLEVAPPSLVASCAATTGFGAFGNKVEVFGGKSASPAAKLAEIQKRLDQPEERKTTTEPQAHLEEPKPGVSIERLVFLERVESIMASEARIKEIEAENKMLVAMVARLNKEIDELKAKLSRKS